MPSIDIGSTVGSYRLVAELGAGGMARLFLGLRKLPDGTRREAAIKVIRPEHVKDQAFVEMFLDEGRIASYVRHPQVVRIHEVGEADGNYFMAMELLHAVTLATFLKGLYRLNRRPSPEVAVAILARVADGLHAAHETTDEHGQLLEIVHRDVSPSNILLGCSGSVKLIDFGIAKAQGRLHKTSFGRTKGKLRYMAPEQMRRTGLDRRADIWSLGVVLWETLATRRLYGKAGDVDVVRRALEGGLQPPGAYADVPFAVDRVVMSCLSVDRERRPATAGELASRLREASPEAAAISEAELSSLIWGVCGDVLDEQARTLPIELPTRSTLTHLRPRPEDSVERFSEPLDETDVATVVGDLDARKVAALAAGAAPERSENPAGAEAEGDLDARPTTRDLPHATAAPVVPGRLLERTPGARSVEAGPRGGAGGAGGAFGEGARELPASPEPRLPAPSDPASFSGPRPTPPPPRGRAPLPLWLFALLAVAGAVVTGILSFLLVRYL